MSISERLATDLKLAMKDHDSLRVEVIRFLMSAIHNQKIAQRAKTGSETDLTSLEELSIVKRVVNQEKETIESFRAAQRADTVREEEKKLVVLQGYLPAMLSEEETKKLIQEVISELKASSGSQFGAVMKEVMARAEGKADGGMVSKILKELLQ